MPDAPGSHARIHRTIPRWVVGTIIGVLLAGAAVSMYVRRSGEAEAEKEAARRAATAAEAAKPVPLQDRPPHYIQLSYSGQVPALKPGWNYVSLRPGYEMGCALAPDDPAGGSGWYFSAEEHDPPRGRREPHTLHIYVDCHVDGVGYRSYRLSGFLPGSIRGVNATGEPVVTKIFLNRIGDQPRQ